MMSEKRYGAGTFVYPAFCVDNNNNKKGQYLSQHRQCCVLLLVKNGRVFLLFRAEKVEKDNRTVKGNLKRGHDFHFECLY